jgi:hypothetical protein
MCFSTGERGACSWTTHGARRSRLSRPLQWYPIWYGDHLTLITLGCWSGFHSAVPSLVIIVSNSNNVLHVYLSLMICGNYAGRIGDVSGQEAIRMAP